MCHPVFILGLIAAIITTTVLVSAYINERSARND